MDDLVQFLRDRLDEDERTARQTHPLFLNWEYDGCVKEIRDFGNGNTLATGVLPHYGAFMHVHDPARVLREVEAKRRTIALCEPPLVETTGLHDTERQFIPGEGRPWGLDVLKLLALPYADHPAYREEWRP
ncbi:DUF6221 family protein [Streptomyces sp. NPDC005774]|uniref:DUF6221 family protein n=1 Tax=Streptomyces sp. NPDC005774 TaxID=3364728 RepID=UPI0036D1D26F